MTSSFRIDQSVSPTRKAAMNLTHHRSAEKLKIDEKTERRLSNRQNGAHHDVDEGKASTMMQKTLEKHGVNPTIEEETQNTSAAIGATSGHQPVSGEG